MNFRKGSCRAPRLGLQVSFLTSEEDTQNDGVSRKIIRTPSEAKLLRKACLLWERPKSFMSTVRLETMMKLLGNR